MFDYTIQNPILPGFYPDPSICRVGEDYYIATSSFSYFPGIPLFHSRDLAHWESIGYALDRPDQLRLNCERISGGLFAPTLRYHNGKFYLIVGNMTTGENLLITAEDPAGDWSDAKNIEGAGGDPSLFWDDDGTCWCSYSKMFGNPGGIVNRQIDLEAGKLVGEEHWLWNGNAYDAHSPESSHIYKKDGWYYLLIAEGGTEHYHATTVARSRSMNGPYKNYRGNPILTHGNLSMYHEIVNIGHSDFVETQNGEWYMVSLASRPYGGYHKNMGRETFIMPVIWESGWPIVSPETGKCEMTYPAPRLPKYPFAEMSARDGFDGETLNWIWNTLGTPNAGTYILRDSALTIPASEIPIENGKKREIFKFPTNPEERAAMHARMEETRKNAKSYALGFVGRRQQHMSYDALASVRFDPKDSESAGLVVLQDGFNQLRVEIAVVNGKRMARAVKFYNVTPANGLGGDLLPALDVQEGFYSKTLGEIALPDGDVVLKISARGQANSFYAGADENHLLPVAENVDGGFMGSETCGGFVGAYIGMFASGNGAPSDNAASFDWFEYLPKEV